MRLVIDLIRGKDVNEAYAILQFNKKRAAKQIDKTLQVRGRERGAEGADGQRVVRRRRARGREGDRERGAAAQAVPAAAQGRADADPEADQPHGNPRRPRKENN